MTPPASTEALAIAPSLGPAHRSVPVGPAAGWRRVLAFLGPGYLVAVGYMDPGNWATDLAGGSRYGYSLLWVVALASAMAVVLQVLSARLGLVTGLDLAQACRLHSRRRSVLAQWALCELAICACDLAEVVGTAIALQLLFGLPLPWGVAATILDVLLLLALQRHGWRLMEATVASLLALVLGCFVAHLVIAGPDWQAVSHGLVPSAQLLLSEPMALMLAVGIVGATVMPHNLYLHSSIVQTRGFERGPATLRQALRLATLDVVSALGIAFFVNAALLVSAGAVFHAHGRTEVAELSQAHALIGGLTGSTLAPVLFAVALLASGLSSSVTATLAGQVVMEGYLQLRMAPWKRRLLTRGLAIVPALAVTLWCGDAGVARLLILSQVLLGLQLPFAMVPLVRLTSRRSLMGDFANGRAMRWGAGAIAALIVSLNLVLVRQALSG